MYERADRNKKPIKHPPKCSYIVTLTYKYMYEWADRINKILNHLSVWPIEY